MALETLNASAEAGVGLPERPPRDDLFRSLFPGVRLRRSEGTAARPVMYGHFARFDEWAEIDSLYEGHFMERVVPGAFAKTIRENRSSMQVLFHHGLDQLGVQVLGEIVALDEDAEGAAYEVSLFDGIPQLVLDGLRAGVYGSSHRFAVVHDEYVQRPKRSEHNPRGIPERSITEAKVREFGPTPFPAYGGATSGVRSMTDEMLVMRMAGDPDRLAQLLGRAQISVPSSVSVTLEADPEIRVEHGRREYRRSVEYIAETPWALHPSMLATIVGIVGERASGHMPSADEIRERIGTRSVEDMPATQPGVAVIPLYGAIVPRASMFSDVSGASSGQSFQASFREALADPDVGAIMIDVDSAGGSVQGIPELAAEIMAARGSKPIVAQVTGIAASAGYWLASACDELVVTPSGAVGSIGVYSSHTDLSAAQAKAGVKKTFISAGDYKVEGNPFEPLSKEAEAAMQADVDAYYEMFVQAVADGRDVTTEKVLADFGQGRMVLATAAVAAGMADSVATFDETLTRLGAQIAEPEPSEATTPDIPGNLEPELSVATTHANGRNLFMFTPDPRKKGN